MTGCLIICRSLTYAQRSARLLTNAGYSAVVQRLPRDISEGGCGYGIRVPERAVGEMLAFLRENNLSAKKVYCFDADGRPRML